MIIYSYLPQLMHGVMVTLILMTASLALGLCFAIVMTACSYSGNIFLKTSVNGLVFFVRGTPLLVQLFLIYYGAGQFEWIRDTILWTVLREPMGCAVLALSINSACYTTVLFQGAIQSVPKNERHACEALGMSKWLAFRRIIFPRAFSIALPAYSNEVVMILKGTSLASTITLLDVMGVTQQMIAQTYQTAEFYAAAAVIYLILYMIISSAFKILLRFIYIF